MEKRRNPSSFPCQRIVVIGTTSSGKSTLAKALAERLGVRVVELDGVASAKLNTFFGVGYTLILSIDPKTLNPIPPGVYKIKASGADSGALATTTLEFIAPIKK